MLERVVPTSEAEALLKQLAAVSVIARCPNTGAELSRSQGQYVLVIDRENHVKRHWSRRNIRTDEEALSLANRALERYLAQHKQPPENGPQ
jgi:hypothetical protein